MSESYVKVILRGPDDDVETLWAETVGENLYRLDNLPWFAYGVSDDDIVFATPTDRAGFFEFVGVVQPSGNRLIRIAFPDPSKSADILAELVAIGCHYEGANPRYVAVSIPPAVDLDAVTSRLTSQSHEWEYANPSYDEVNRGRP